MVCRVEVADLQLTEQADAKHLDTREDENTGDDEDWSVLIEDVTVRDDLQD